MIEALRTGSWLTPSRLRAYPLLLGLGLGAALLVLTATRSGSLDHWGRPLGTDFSQIWVAGQEIWDGHPALPYDNAAHAAAQAAIFGHAETFYSWPYPPYFLALAALAATMPYLVALAVWQGATLALYCGAVLQAAGRSQQISRGTILGVALVFPAVTVNLMHGHNGFLTAGLLGFGTMLLPRRPILAGILLGLLAYKPQFALALPLALLAGGFWRASAAAGLTVGVATLATIAAFGLEPWTAFFGSLTFTRAVVLEQGGPGFDKMQSAFAAVRLIGGSIPLAYAIQGAVTGSVCLGLAWLWRSAADHRLKAAGLMAASLLTTPYCLDYDMTVLGPAIAAIVFYGLDRGFAPYGKSLLAVCWILPLIARPVASSVALPLGAITMFALFWFTVATVMIEKRGLERCESATPLRGIAPGAL